MIPPLVYGAWSSLRSRPTHAQCLRTGLYRRGCAFGDEGFLACIAANLFPVASVASIRWSNHHARLVTVA